MADTLQTHDNVLATGMSFEEYLVAYDGQFVEWIRGVVIDMSPVSRTHDNISQFLILLLRSYLEVKPAGELFVAPYVMRASADSPAREPDLQLLLNEHLDRDTGTYINGPCDLAIEIVSPESSHRDRGEKFGEYEAAGVQEFWLIDPLRNETLFYSLGDGGRYQPLAIEDGLFHSTLLPDFTLDTELLWQVKLPGPREIARMVDLMTHSNQD